MCWNILPCILFYNYSSTDESFYAVTHNLSIFWQLLDFFEPNISVDNSFHDGRGINNGEKLVNSGQVIGKQRGNIVQRVIKAIEIIDLKHTTVLHVFFSGNL